MALEETVKRKIAKDVFISLFIYALPVLAVYFYFQYNGNIIKTQAAPLPGVLNFLKPIAENFRTWGLPVLMLIIGTIEFSFGLYDHKWTKNEKILDVACFLVPKLITPPTMAFFSLKVLPIILPSLDNTLTWIPFWYGFIILAVADDLTQYWYHRLHHQLPILWRFHRTHHSAPYMGMAMANRQNVIYTILFSQVYLTSALTYLGLALPAVFVTAIKSIITMAAHSSIAWDKPFYKYKVLHPIAWVLERLISTPATHHAHHANRTDDGVGYYKGNFGNMFFIWDIIFGTGIITRQYPASYGIKGYQSEEWYAQFLWPFFKSKKEGSELSVDGPEVAAEIENDKPQLNPIQILQSA